MLFLCCFQMFASGCCLEVCEVQVFQAWVWLSKRTSLLPLRLSTSTSAAKARLPLYASTLTPDNLTSRASDDNPSMAAKPPPPGLVDLATAQGSGQNSLVGVIGVVVDYLPPKQAYGRDWQVTFRLKDQSNRYFGEGLKVRFFKKRFEDLPPVKAIGDVVLIRGVKISEFAGEILLVSSIQTAHLVFSGAVVPSPAFKLDYVGGNGKLPCQGNDGLRKSLGPIEQDYIITLKSELSVQIKAVDAPPPVPVGPSARPAQSTQPGFANRAATSGLYSHKFKLVQDLQSFVFSDVCVEVVKKFINYNGNCELYVTDYTPNKQMFYYAPPEEKNDLVRDGDEFGYNGPPKRDWPGPYGFLVLKVNMVDPHASFANHSVSEGDMIALENVKVKLMPNNSRLEGDMWPDQHNPSKVQVRKLDRRRTEITNLLMRKSKYLAERQAMLEKLGKATEAQIDQKMSKKAKKKKSKREARQKAEQKAEAEQAAAVKYAHNTLAIVLPQKESH